jgi:hypothetical protein
MEDALSCALAFPANPNLGVDPPRKLLARGCAMKCQRRGSYFRSSVRRSLSLSYFRRPVRCETMNFIDVQPKSFLDYAWTSPTPTVMSAPKPSKTSRKQNRCCDQCRKGKRACDAAILEDSLLDTSKSGDHPSVFHYSGELHSPREQHSRRLTMQMFMDL